MLPEVRAIYLFLRRDLMKDEDEWKVTEMLDRSITIEWTQEDLFEPDANEALKTAKKMGIGYEGKRELDVNVVVRTPRILCKNKRKRNECYFSEKIVYEVKVTIKKISLKRPHFLTESNVSPAGPLPPPSTLGEQIPRLNTQIVLNRLNQTQIDKYTKWVEDPKLFEEDNPEMKLRRKELFEMGDDDEYWKGGPQTMFDCYGNKHEVCKDGTIKKKAPPMTPIFG